MKPEDQLIEQLDAFIAFTRKRLNDPDLAADVVQDSLLKALKSLGQIRDDEQVTAWFYRILRHSIIDAHRRRGARQHALEKFGQQWPETPDEDEKKDLCRCFRLLLPEIPATYRELLQRIDLDGEDAAAVAADLKLTRNHVAVRLHRARKHLREELLRICQACAKHGCLDCGCKDG